MGVARFSFCGPTITNDGQQCFLFFFTDGGSKKYIEVSQQHPTFQNPPFFWKIWIEEKQQCRPIKIFWKESEKDKKLFQKEDFIEIEEI